MLKKTLKERKTIKKKFFLLDPDIYNSDEKSKENVGEDNLSQMEDNQDIMYNFYEKYNDKIKKKVQEDIKKMNGKGKEKNKNKKELFEEFKEFIDEDNEEFKEFIN